MFVEAERIVGVQVLYSPVRSPPGVYALRTSAMINRLPPVHMRFLLNETIFHRCSLWAKTGRCEPQFVPKLANYQHEAWTASQQMWTDVLKIIKSPISAY